MTGPAYDPEAMAARLARLRQLPVPATEKGLAGALGRDAAPASLIGRRLEPDSWQTPLLVLLEPALRNNIAAMREYCAGVGVWLAPHGKTTLSPQLLARQLAAGAWAITAANIRQTQLYRSFGVRRVLLANQLVDPAGIAWLATEREHDRGFDFYCYVDTQDGIALLEDAWRHHRDSVGPLPVLVELGWPGGRTGARGGQRAQAVARAAAASDCLEVAGVAGFEGASQGDASSRTLADVAQFSGQLRDLAAALVSGGLAGRAPFLVSAGGSAYFDVVVRELTRLPADQFQVVLRSGCYLTHDHGMYAMTSPFERATAGTGRLVPALELWTRVLSSPEPGRAYLDAGRPRPAT